jgi:hypothetical protein
MLVQKQESIIFGIGLRFQVDGHGSPSSAAARAQISAIETELASQRDKIGRQRTEASLYSGGLVQALGLTPIKRHSA